MKNRFKRFKKSFCYILFCTFSVLHGQDKKNSFPITLSIFNESTVMPFTSFFTLPIHSGFQFSTELNYNKILRNRLFQTFGTSYYYHQYLNQSVTVFTELGYEFRTNLGIETSFLLGIGYMRSFRTSTEYEFDNGSYKKSRNLGVGRFVPSFSLETGYYIFPKNAISSKVFLKYQTWIEYPFSPNFIEIMPHQNVHIGVKFYI
ncbi:conserved exported hypothetical protein [Flavobacterium sp. 9AF]|uniref:hypothetical protein n=1 Tax=Flavobacterium sp. 9AF TaxID=2653142 RepID=UPI0012EF146C|nr:hypothetical protein [Flavobacterium sp. 9AF]VXA94863.1 conserved exported hypothetical protein [Flavobacterium sp. 9AF]